MESSFKISNENKSNSVVSLESLNADQHARVTITSHKNAYQHQQKKNLLYVLGDTMVVPKKE